MKYLLLAITSLVISQASQAESIELKPWNPQCEFSQILGESGVALSNSAPVVSQTGMTELSQLFSTTERVIMTIIQLPEAEAQVWFNFTVDTDGDGELTAEDATLFHSQNVNFADGGIISPNLNIGDSEYHINCSWDNTSN